MLCNARHCDYAQHTRYGLRTSIIEAVIATLVQTMATCFFAAYQAPLLDALKDRRNSPDPA